jgi:hypothetical protein
MQVMSEDEKDYIGCAVGIVACDEDDYIVKVVSRSGRPD